MFVLHKTSLEKQSCRAEVNLVEGKHQVDPSLFQVTFFGFFLVYWIVWVLLLVVPLCLRSLTTLGKCQLVRQYE